MCIGYVSAWKVLPGAYCAPVCVSLTLVGFSRGFTMLTRPRQESLQSLPLLVGTNCRDPANLLSLSRFCSKPTWEMFQDLVLALLGIQKAPSGNQAAIRTETTTTSQADIFGSLCLLTSTQKHTSKSVFMLTSHPVLSHSSVAFLRREGD